VRFLYDLVFALAEMDALVELYVEVECLERGESLAVEILDAT
jgi:hypothetical protein